MSATSQHILSRGAELADVLLLAALRQRSRHMILEPSGPSEHRLLLRRGNRTTNQAVLGGGSGSAMIERLRYLSSIDPVAGEPQSASLEVGAGDRSVRMFMTTSGSGAGSRAELWLLEGTTDFGDSDAELRPGAEIGAYQIGEMIGHGGMGVVYRAHHRWLDRNCAIKVLRADLTGDDDSTQAFFREARLGALTAHDGTAAILDVGTLGDGRPFIVMELIEGRSLGDIIDDEGPVEPIRAAHLIRQAAQALSVLHDRGVVHCDVTPGNIFVSGRAPAETVKLVDFGLAQLRDQIEDEDSELVYGTPAYMAPERIHGKRCDGRTDLYALGAVFFELLTGKPPFLGANPVEVAHKHVKAMPLAAWSPKAELPGQMAEIVARLLRKRPGDRYSDARGLIGALDQVLSGNDRRTVKLWWRNDQ